MAGRIGSVQKAQDGQSYGFVIYDTQDRASLYLGFSPGIRPTLPHGRRKACW